MPLDGRAFEAVVAADDDDFAEKSSAGLPNSVMPQSSTSPYEASEEEEEDEDADEDASDREGDRTD